MNWGGGSKNGWLLRTKLAKAVAVQNTDMLKEFFKNNLNKTFLIPRGVNTEEFSPQKPKEALREKWNVSPEKRILICVANLVPVKGIEILLNAFSKVNVNFPEWVLLIVGDTNNEYGKEMIDLSKELKLSNSVVFTGKQPNVKDYLNISEIFVLPTLSKGEGSPLALLEAMATEKFVLASDIPGIKDQLENFPENLVEAGNVDAWAWALEKAMYKDIEWLESKGTLFRKHVLQNYKIEHEVKNCEAMYTIISNR